LTIEVNKLKNLKTRKTKPEETSDF
jgi:hypothetical protein